MSFENPSAFLLIVLAPLAYFLFRRRKHASTSFSSVSLLADLPVSFRQRALVVLPWLRVVAIVLLVIAIARPRKVLGKKRESTKGIAIELVVDRSGSMGQEVQYKQQLTNRLELVKQVLSSFVLGNESDLEGRENDLIGMITFARYSDTICPLVRNPKALTQLIKNIQLVQVRSEDGTAIGDAILLAASRLHQAEKDLAAQIEQGLTTPIKIQSKVVILLTDGSNNAGDITPEKAALKAKEWGVKLYTIALTEKAKRSFFNFGSRVDTELLKTLADYTNGKFYEVQDPNKLQAVYQDIDRLERTNVELPEYIRGDEQFTYWAAAAALLFLTEWLLALTWLRRQ